MATRKRQHDFDDVFSKRVKIESELQSSQSSKRCREEEEFVMNKRMSLSSEFSDIKNEIMGLQLSFNEMKQHQQMCYKIMAGQCAQIRQLEQLLHSIQNPVVEPWVQPVVYVNQ